jgi:hypothetical protein
MNSLLRTADLAALSNLNRTDWKGLFLILAQRGRQAMETRPLASLAALVAGGAALFYLAERGKNDKVRHIWDAVDFVATSASVGYSNIFPTTPLGRVVGSVLFLVGPSLASRVTGADRSGTGAERGRG